MAWPKGKPRAKKSGDVEAAPVTAASAPAPVEHEAVQSPPPISAEALGNLAKHLLDNPAFEEAYRRAIGDVFKAWEATDPTATAEREAIYHQVGAMRSFKRALSTMKQEGKLAGVRSERLRIA